MIHSVSQVRRTCESAFVEDSFCCRFSKPVNPQLARGTVIKSKYFYIIISSFNHFVSVLFFVWQYLNSSPTTMSFFDGWYKTQIMRSNATFAWPTFFCKIVQLLPLIDATVRIYIKPTPRIPVLIQKGHKFQ